MRTNCADNRQSKPMRLCERVAVLWFLRDPRCWVTILTLALFQGRVPAAEPEPNFHVMMMEATCKIEIPPNLVATGFIMVQKEAEAKSLPATVLITANHVFADSKGSTNATLHLRTLPAGSSNYVQVPVSIRIRDEKGNQTWTKHPSVDLAAIRLGLPGWLPRVRISTAVLIGDQNIMETPITPGFEVFCLGFPFGMEGPERFPVLRTAKIASFPLTPTRDRQTFLVDMTVFEGNSGGPVYVFVENSFRAGGLVTMHGILGVISQKLDVNVPSESYTGKRIDKVNLGLAQVIHASLVKELLDILP